MAEREGFEPPIPCGIHDFESRAFDQLGHRSAQEARFLLEALALSNACMRKSAPMASDKSSHVIEAAMNGQTLAAVMRHMVPGTPWSKARTIVESGKVDVNGVRQTDSAMRVSQGDQVSLNMGAPKQKRGALLKEAFVYIDDDIVVVNKPAGVMSVPFSSTDRDTLIDQAMVALGARGKHGAELGAVHRLDKETSGLLVFSRTLAAKRALQEQFRAHDLERRYLAIAHGIVEDATHQTALIEDRGDGLRGSFGVFHRTSAPVPKHAREATTHVWTLATQRNASLVECRLETGRQHQIRIHLSESGHPLVGEHVYIRDYKGEKIGSPRPMLHAWVLGFTHPRTGETVRFIQESPADFAEMMTRLRLVLPANVS